MNTADAFNIPSDILTKARDISVWFQTQGIEDWELMDICSRNLLAKEKRKAAVYEQMSETGLNLMEETSKILEKRSGESLPQAAQRVVDNK